MANALTNGAYPVNQGQPPPPPAPSAPQSPQDAAAAPPDPTDQGDAPDAQAAAPDAAQAPPDQGDQGDQPPMTLQSANIDPEKLQDAIYKMAEMTVRMSALAERPTVARSDVVSAMIKIVTDGVMNPVMASGFMTDLPESPDDVKEWVQRHADKGHQLLAQMAYAQHGSAAPPPDQGAPAPDDTGAAAPPQ